MQSQNRSKKWSIFFAPITTYDVIIDKHPTLALNFPWVVTVGRWQTIDDARWPSYSFFQLPKGSPIRFLWAGKLFSIFQYDSSITPMHQNEQWWHHEKQVMHDPFGQVSAESNDTTVQWHMCIIFFFFTLCLCPFRMPQKKCIKKQQKLSSKLVLLTQCHVRTCCL